MSARNMVRGIFTAALLVCSTTLSAQDNAPIKEVQIGNQIWTAENMKTNVAGSFSYKMDPANIKLYGRLYTWEAAKKACPEGWHLPSDAEWNELTTFLGGVSVAGSKLKASGNSGFNAVFGGVKSEKALEFDQKNYNAVFWSSTPFQGNTVWAREIKSFSPMVLEAAYDKNAGLSCRCVKNK